MKSVRQICSPLIAFRVLVMKIKLANSFPQKIAHCAGAAFGRTMQASQPGGLNLITLFLLAELLYLSLRKQTYCTQSVCIGRLPVGAFNRQRGVKEEIIKG